LFRGDEGAPIALIDAVDRADIRVVQRGGSTRLAAKVTKRMLWHVPPSALSFREPRYAFSDEANRLFVGNVRPL
jgi:hypothetical protein